MSIVSKTTVKSYFETGDKPTQAQFSDLVDSYQDYSSALSIIATAVASAASGKVVASDGNGGLRFQNAGAGTMIGPNVSTKYGLVTYADTSGQRTDNNNVTLSSAGDISGLATVSASAVYANTGSFDNLQFQVVNASAGNFGTVNVSGDITVSGNGSFKDITSIGKLTASAAAFSGVVSANNGLGVSGRSDFKGSVTVSGDVSVSGDGTFKNLTSTGNLTASAAAFSGVVSANNGLGVSGRSDFKGSITVSGDVSVSGDGTFRNLTSTGNITASAATFTGQVNANNGLSVSGAAAFKQNVTVSGNISVSGDGTFKDLTTNGTITGSAANFSGLVNANNGLTVSGVGNFKGNVNVSGNAYVSGQFTGGAVAYRVFTATTTASTADFGKVLVCQASATATVALRDGTDTYPQGWNVRIRNRRSGMVQVIIPAADKIVGGVAYQITAQNKEAIFEVESVSGSEHTWWSAGTN